MKKLECHIKKLKLHLQRREKAKYVKQNKFFLNEDFWTISLWENEWDADEMKAGKPFKSLPDSICCS